jgi:carboxylesterase type B
VAALGFLAGSEVKANGVLNAGLLDQRKALEWTKKYISHFGGDPKHVVMLGGSSGAGSISLQLAAYGGRDDSLFVGAVGDAIFSPTVNNATFSQYQFDQFAVQTGCGAATDKLACLRALDISTLQKANVQEAYPGQSMLAQYIWTPVVDGTFVADYPLRLYQDGKFVKVPLITGDGKF